VHCKLTLDSLHLSVRRLLATVIDAESFVEKNIAEKISAGLPDAQKIVVRDTSGGCGFMYSIEVVAESFA